MVIKGGVVAWSAMGEGNASVHGAEPTRYGPDWGATGEAAARLSTTFVSRAALDAGVAPTLSTRRRIVAVGGTRASPAAISWPTPRCPRSSSPPMTGRSPSTDGCSRASRSTRCRSPPLRLGVNAGGRRPTAAAPSGRASEGQAAFSPTSSGMTINPYPAVPLPQAYTW